MHIGIYDAAKVNLIASSASSVFLVSLVCSPNSSCLGIDISSNYLIPGNFTTINGEITLHGLRILSSGTFRFIVEGTGITTATPDITIETTLKAINVTNELSQPINTLIQLQVMLFDNNNNTFTQSTNVTIDCSGVLRDTTTSATSNGTLTFYMIFLSVGSELCTISADGILTTLNIATTPSDNTNLECSIFPK